MRAMTAACCSLGIDTKITLLAAGLILLLAFRHHGFALLHDTLGSEALSGGSTHAALLTALAVGGWVFAFFGAMMLVQLVWTVRVMPETNGVALEDMDLGSAQA